MEKMLSDTDPKSPSQASWKGPTIGELAKMAGVGTATVDRVLNNRPGVRDKTRQKVHDALKKLTEDGSSPEKPLDLRLFCESGESFNAAMMAAEAEVNRTIPGAVIHGEYVNTSQFDAAGFARRIEEEGSAASGVIVVAREHPAVNRAIRKLVRDGIPTICLTSDLPSSRRSTYVGNDQYAAGSVAGHLVGRALPKERGRILLVTSVPFRCQQEREMGFRRVLRLEFPHLKIDDRVISDELPETTFQNVRAYIEAKGPPAAVYNVAGANRGVAKALETAGADQETVFVGHELTRRSRELLAAGIMDYVISHDFVDELSAASRWIRDNASGHAIYTPSPSAILVHTKYNCS